MTETTRHRSATNGPASRKQAQIKVTPLGGLGAIGMNMHVIEYDNQMILMDAGSCFPSPEHMGVDLIIPDITYLLKNEHNLLGIFLSHGHEDHIGAVPFLIRELNVPIYGAALTMALVRNKLEEFELLDQAQLHVIDEDSIVQTGPFKVEFITVNHSIMDAYALAITTPQGVIIYTGDFKLDQTPLDGKFTDLHKFAHYGLKGVLLLMSDSTNALSPGYSLSEREVIPALQDIFSRAKQKILVATFASNIMRMQQVILMAEKFNRKVIICGKSMEDNITTASTLGYVKASPGLIIPATSRNKYPPEKLVVLMTGSQGEELSALTRVSLGTHRMFSVDRGDTVIISAKMIPGNEKAIGKTINNLARLGAEVISDRISEIHVSGHAAQEEQKLILNLTKPTYFMPIHGEYRHLLKHAQTARNVGVPERNIYIMENGESLHLTRSRATLKTAQPMQNLMVDGKCVGDIGEVVLNDRQILSQDGIAILHLCINPKTRALISPPHLITRGFVYEKLSKNLLDEATSMVIDYLRNLRREDLFNLNETGVGAKKLLRKFFFNATGRRPMIIVTTSGPRELSLEPKRAAPKPQKPQQLLTSEGEHRADS